MMKTLKFMNHREQDFDRCGNCKYIEHEEGDGFKCKKIPEGVDEKGEYPWRYTHLADICDEYERKKKC